MEDESEIEDEELQYEILEEYDQFLSDHLGLEILKRPSAKAKKEIIREAIRLSSVDNEWDFEKLILKYAKDCFQPLYLEKSKLLSSVLAAQRGFLPSSHPMSEDLELNNGDPALEIKQLLKKPSLEQITAVVQAMKEHDPNWQLWDGHKSAAEFATVLWNNFPDLRKNSAQANRIFGDTARPATSQRRKPKKKKKKSVMWFVLLVTILLFIYKSCSG